MNASSETVAREVCEHLAPYLPLDVSLKAEVGLVSIIVRSDVVGKSGAFAVLNDNGGPFEIEDVATASRIFLSAVQDYIADSTHLQWPVDSSGQPLEPHVAVSDENTVVLELRRGETPVLKLRLIACADR